MKKIMFNDKCGLTDAVLQGRKTMTRRICKEFSTGRIIYANEVESVGVFSDDNVVEFVLKDGGVMVSGLPYKIGEVVAVAQAYKDLAENDYFSSQCAANEESVSGLKNEKGWSNKMFVLADLMLNKIRITDVKVEMLQDISDGDCFKEGIIPITWRQHLQQDFDDLSPQKYIDHNVYSLEKFREGIEDCWAESDPNEYMAEDAKTAFAVLIFKMYGRKVWEGNPYVFAYSFELVK